MDPITAISLVSGIISFVSFSKDFVKGAIKIHASQDGYSQDNQNREFVADELRRFSVSLQPPGESGLAGEEKALASLAAKCHELAEDMTKALDKIKAKDPNSKMQSVWAALKATAHEKDLMDFERRLDQCATQMHLQLTFFMSRHTEATLDRLIASASSDATALERLQTNVDQFHQSVGTANKDLAEQVDQVMQLLGKALDTAIQQRILNSLCFEGMTTRFEMVEEAHLDTFRWMLDASAFVYDTTLESIRSLFGEPALDGDLDDAWDSEWGSEDEGDNAAEETDGESGDEESEIENSELEDGNVDGQYSEEEDADDGTDDDGTEDDNTEDDGNEDRNAEDEEEEGEEEKYDDYYGGDETVLLPAMVSTGREVPSAYYRGLTKRSMKSKFTTGKGFIEWLSSLDGIFHISGKMGSGKSTLMRFLYEHPATTYELNRWAGLLRALLHATLETCPELMPVVMPAFWKQIKAQPWQDQAAIHMSSKDIRDALVRLIQNPEIHNNYRLCFFIDGLDEYEGTIQEDQRHMVDFLLRWIKASRGSLKICVSSREHNIFMDAFRADKRIRLHEFTKYDMERYTDDKLKHIPNTNTREILVQGILSRAHGIFLWVALVVKTVREHVENDATEDELASLLSSIPEELDDLFEHLFMSISKVNSRRACQVFTLLLAGRKHDIRLYLYGVSFLEEYERNERFAFLETPQKLERARQEATAKTAHTRKQLNTWCKGLVDAVYRPEAHTGCERYRDLQYQVDFTHRSIYDFLESNTTMMDTNWQPFLRGFDAVDALSQITWATHKPTLITCPRLFPFGEIMAMRWGNGRDSPPFEYLERLANGDRDHMTVQYEKFDDHVVAVVGVLYRDCWYSKVASRRLLASEEPEIRNEFVDATTCSFGILLHAAREGHFGYLKWKIQNHQLSINNSDKAVLLICTFLESTVSLELSHPTASSMIPALLFKHNLVSPDLMSFWAPGNLAGDMFSTIQELINLKLSVWHWYLLRVTSCFTASFLDKGLPRRMVAQLSAQRRSQIGHALEAFLEHGADPYFVLSVSVITETIEWGGVVHRFQLDFEFGRKRIRISMVTGGWMSKRPNSFGRFSLNQDLKLTFQQWIEMLELSNHERLISLLGRNRRLEEERLEQEAAKERISYDTATSATSASEGNKPSDVGAMDGPAKLTKGGAVTGRAGIGGLYAQISLLVLGILIALSVRLLWGKSSSSK